MLSAHASLGLEVEKGHIDCIAQRLLNLAFCHLRRKIKPINFFMYCNYVSNRSAIKTIAIKTRYYGLSLAWNIKMKVIQNFGISL